MIKIIKDNIIFADVDIIVNAANNTLLGGYGVDGAIHKACGPELLKECKKIGWCETGNAVITPAFNIKAKYIIHTVGPVWTGGFMREATVLAGCYKKCLQLAIDNKCKSIAFPCLCCGEYGYPIGEAASITIQTINDFIKDTPIDVVLVCFTQDEYNVYNKTFTNINSLNNCDYYNRDNGLDVEINLNKTEANLFSVSDIKEQAAIIILSGHTEIKFTEELIFLPAVSKKEIDIDVCLDYMRRGPFVADDCIQNIVINNNVLSFNVKPFVFTG